MSAWSTDFTAPATKEKPILVRGYDFPLPFVVVWNAADQRFECEEGEDVVYVEVCEGMEWAAIPE